MATYAFGDLQGCFTAFRHLLDLIRFDPAQDKLWLVGDIVNRGPDSLSLLRYIKQAGDAIITVLGNHDLHLLMVAAGIARNHPSDTIQPILDAPDRDELLYWLRQQKLFHSDGRYAMVHAGLLPSWSISQAAQLAGEVENALRDANHHELFARMYGNEPNYWQDDWTGYIRLRVIINAMTRMRVCTPDGRMNFVFKGDLPSIPAGYMPWFSVPHRINRDTTIICGHWSALGLHIADNIIALDSGCVWGGPLSAIRLQDQEVFQIPCAR
ncbi:MAG: symmetrical bis(5'-nucleosyl)-tetraphosphatase [Proteobacteria bacterium]|jgi:bis(5'-nucleosyl)-tetraphosphatase (symmetrical)|nr:symmetrical bis(5'-nucleosyl)-tetraphosphatase [Pseudomonadota bacterium]